MKRPAGASLLLDVLGFQVEFDAMEEGGAKLKTVIREEEWSVSLGDR